MKTLVNQFPGNFRSHLCDLTHERKRDKSFICTPVQDAVICDQPVVSSRPPSLLLHPSKGYYGFHADLRLSERGAFVQPPSSHDPVFAWQSRGYETGAVLSSGRTNYRQQRAETVEGHLVKMTSAQLTVNSRCRTLKTRGCDQSRLNSPTQKSSRLLRTQLHIQIFSRSGLLGCIYIYI